MENISEQSVLEEVHVLNNIIKDFPLTNKFNNKVKVYLDTFEYSTKPKGKEIGVISKRIIKHPTEISVENLANEIIKGKTFVPASFKVIDGSMKRSKIFWSSQQVFALDFDDNFTLDEALGDKFFQENASFLYTTFNHTEQKNKFRVVFILDKVVTSYKEYDTVIEMLLEMYPSADRACRDGSRLFFGGNELFIFSFENRLILDEYIDRTPLQDINSNISMSVTPFESNHSKNIYNDNNIQLILSKDIATLRKRINIVPITLSKNEVLDYLKRQDLRQFLGVDSVGNIKDIFHDEENPSASIYLSNKGTGHWLYKCHSQSHPFTGTILHIVQRLLNCTMYEAKDFLEQVYDINIYESKEVKELKESIDIYKSLLISDELEEIHPNFYKVFNSYGYLTDFYLLLDISKEYITADSEPRSIFYHSIGTLAKKFRRSTSSTGTRMNFFTLFKIVRKLDEEEIPESLLKLQKKIKDRIITNIIVVHMKFQCTHMNSFAKSMNYVENG